MARTTAAEVLLIFHATVVEATVDAFIEGATALVDEVLGDDTTINDDLKEQIERWLTGHMMASTIKRLAKKEGAGGASIEYTGKFDANLSSTPYGQMVLTLDSTGKMAGLGGKTVSITAVTEFE